MLGAVLRSGQQEMERGVGARGTGDYGFFLPRFTFCWRDGVVIKHTGCPSRGPSFESQHPFSSSQPLSFQRPLEAPQALHTCGAQTTWHQNGHTRKTNRCKMRWVVFIYITFVTFPSFASLVYVCNMVKGPDYQLLCVLRNTYHTFKKYILSKKLNLLMYQNVKMLTTLSITVSV